MALPILHGEGRIVGQPELRYTPNGQPVLNMTIACNKRKYNEQTQQWEDAGVYWLNRAALWGKPGENGANYYQDKDLVVFEVELETEQFEKDGQKRSATRHKILKLGKVAPRVDSPQGGQQGGFGQFGGFGQGQQGGFGQGQADPWGSSPQQGQPAGAAAGGFGGYSDEPPF